MRSFLVCFKLFIFLAHNQIHYLMKKFPFLTLSFVIVFLIPLPSLAQVLLSGNWEGEYSNNQGLNEAVVCSIFQDGLSVHGTFEVDGEVATFSGDITSDFDSAYVVATNSRGAKIHAQVSISATHMNFTYQLANTVVYGWGELDRVGDTRTLIINYNYSGTKEVSGTVPLGIAIYDNPDVLGSAELMRINYTSKSGTTYISGINCDTVYCMAYTGFSDSMLYFLPLDLAYTVHGDPATLTCMPIVIQSGSSDTIDLFFDDTYIYPMAAQFPGGKLDLVDAVLFGFQPNSITSDPSGNIYISEFNYVVYKYDPLLENSELLTDNLDNTIYAGIIKFATDGSFYVLYSSYLRHYSASRQLLSSAGVGYEWNDLAIGSDGSVFYIANNEIIRLTSTLALPETLLVEQQLIEDYPVIGSDFYIRSLALDNDGNIAISIDVEPDDDGRDAILFYNNGFTSLQDVITERWEFNNPYNIEFDADNNLYVLNRWHDDLLVFNSQRERYQASFWSDNEGTLNGAMSDPRDLTLANGKIYVGERDNHRVSIFRLKGSIDQNLFLADLNVENGTIDCFNAYDTITVAGDELHPVVFKNGSELSLIAGKAVRLLPGFLVEEGSHVDIYITETGSFCDMDKSTILSNPLSSIQDIDIQDFDKEDIGTGNVLKIFPNPNNGKFLLSMKEYPAEGTVMIYTVMGTLVYRSDLEALSGYELSLPLLTRGLYFVKVSGSGECYTAKMMVD